MSEATPRPWRLGKPNNGFIWGPDPTRGCPAGANWPLAEIRSRRGRVIMSKEDRANAELIVKCVNYHEELVDALRLSLTCLDAAADGRLHEVADEIGGTANIVDALLAKVAPAKVCES